MAALPSYYAPDFDATLNGIPMPAELRAAVISLRFDEALEGADRVELQLADPHLTLLDHPLLDLDVRLDLSLGYQPNGLLHVFSGDLTGIEPTLSSQGMPTLSVNAHDFMRRLTEGTKQRGFPWYLPDTVIATIVAAENRLISIPDAAASLVSGLGVINQRPRYQHKQTDYDFLRQIATEYGFDMWVDGDTLNFKLLISRLPASDLSLAWGESLVDFAPRVSSIGQIAAVSLRVWIETLKSELVVTVSWDGERIAIKVAPAAFGASSPGSGASLTLPDIPHDTPVDAIKWALGELRRRINTRVTARGSCLGDPRMRAGSVIAISKTGKRFSSDSYRLTSVSHSLDGNGYHTNFEARLEVI